MRKYRDLSGQTRGLLTILPNTYVKKGVRYWECTCTCGTKRFIRVTHLNASIKSCGCIKASRAGNQSHPLYRVWENTRQKCYNYTNDHFHKVGGAGIKLCERWQSFKNFAGDVGPRPEGKIFKRIDDSKWFGPDNFVWVSRGQLKITDDGLV